MGKLYPSKLRKLRPGGRAAACQSSCVSPDTREVGWQPGELCSWAKAQMALPPAPSHQEKDMSGL
jgi:hypothetical protein